MILGKARKVCSGKISAEEMDSSIKLWIKHEQLFLRRETKFSYCFKNVGLDYARPLFYKDVVQNKMQKCYILFTCIISRVIHLELTNDLGVAPLKLAFHRFISRRGTPNCFISDNFKTFQVNGNQTFYPQFRY